MANPNSRKPGVSIRTPQSSNKTISRRVEVCRPFCVEELISDVLSTDLLQSLFIKELFPTPEEPIKTTVSFRAIHSRSRCIETGWCMLVLSIGI